MQVVKQFKVTKLDETVKYIPVFANSQGQYFGLFTKTDDGAGITIAGAKCNSEFDIEQIATLQFGFGIGPRWSNLTSIHTIGKETPKVLTIIELISFDQAQDSLRNQSKIVSVQLGRSDYIPPNASGILKFFFAVFAKKNSQVNRFVCML